MERSLQMTARRTVVRLAMTVALFSAGAGGTLAAAAGISGVVTTTDARPISGALVTLWNEAGNRKETVYTGADGRYALRTDFSGKLNLRVRTPYFKDVTKPLTVAAGDAGAANAAVNFEIEKLSDPMELSNTLTASAHLGEVQWQDPDMRAAFVSECNYCHQMGNELTRTPKDEAGWRATINRMEGYFALLTASENKVIAKTLARDLNGAPVKAIQTYDVSPELARAKVEEFHAGDALSFIHDMFVGEDGLYYGSDEGHDIIWVLDPKTGKLDQYPLPKVDLPEGGVFSGIQLPIGVFTGQHGPHSFAQTRDGLIWVTLSLSSSLASFDPVTKAMKLYPMGHDHLYPHTIRVDKEGMLWFTINASNEAARFDPKTGKFDFIALPHNGFWRAIVDWTFPSLLKAASWFPKQNWHLSFAPHKFTQGHLMMNSPYGIDINPLDGSVWYAKLHASKLGRIDPKTLAVVEFDTPLKGPRRPRFDKEGILWIPAFDDGALLRYDPKSNQFETFKLPTLSPREYEVPYALNVHPATGDIWITSNMSDRIFRFTPATRRFVSYPMPTRVMWLRDMEFTKEGKVCSSSSNLPAYGIEDKVDAFICLDPEGGARDMAAVATAPASAR